MENEEAISEIDTDMLTQQPRISKLAVASMVFGMLGPLSAGAMWIASLNESLTIGNPLIIGLFSCGLTWILGLIFGMKSLEQIDNSEGQLFGREYAIGGAVISVVWVVLVLLGLLLPALFSINS